MHVFPRLHPGSGKLGQDLPGRAPSGGMGSHPSSPTIIPTVLNTTGLEGWPEAGSHLHVTGKRANGRAAALSWPRCIHTLLWMRATQ